MENGGTGELDVVDVGCVDCGGFGKVVFGEG